GMCELSFILCVRRVGLIACLLIRRGIDLRQHVAGFDFLPFREGDFDQLPVHARVNCDGVERLYRAETIEIDWHVLGRNHALHYENWQRLTASSRRTRRRGGYGPHTIINTID